MGETVIPHRLPIKNLKWKRLIPSIGKARECLARFDERLKKNKNKQTFREKNVYANEALKFGIQWAEKKPLNLDFLCRVHGIVKQDAANPEEIGKLRTKQNWIGPEGKSIEEAYFFPPPYKTVKRYMQQLLDYMRTEDVDPLVQLAIFFAQFLIIHPFMDGNGRVARIYIPIWLWKKGLICKPAFFLNAYFEKNRLTYFRKLNFISENEAWEDWIEYFLKGIIEESEGT